MPSFLHKCSCRGVKPTKVLRRKHNSRPEILVNLMQDRHVARVLKAPAGSGKSSLVFEYTNIVFGFNHVFWIDCISPCFLRDLDKESIFKEILQINEKTELVVFEDVPLLDNARVEKFNILIDELLEKEIEVLITCTPSVDTFSHIQRDAIVLTAKDLLLTEMELRNKNLNNDLSVDDIKEIAQTEKIACMRWSDSGVKQILAGLSLENLDAETKLAMFAMLVICNDSLDVISNIMRPEMLEDVVPNIAKSYFCFGIDLRLRLFSTVSCSIREISQDFCKDIDQLCGASIYNNKDELCFTLADLLIAQGEVNRACEFILENVDKERGATWLCDHGFDFLHLGEANAIMNFCENVKFLKYKNKSKVDILVMLALYQLGDWPAIPSICKRIIRCKTTENDVKAAAAALLLRVGSQYVNDESYKNLDKIKEAMQENLSKCESQQENHCGTALDFYLIAKLAAALETSMHEFIVLLACQIDIYKQANEQIQNLDGTLDAIFLGISWLFENMSPQKPTARQIGLPMLNNNCLAEEYLQSHKTLNKIFSFIFDSIRDAKYLDKVGFYLYKAVISYKLISSDIQNLFDVSADKRDLIIFDSLDTRFLKEKDLYQKRKSLRQEDKREYILTHPDAFRSKQISKEEEQYVHMGVPTLKVKLFGGMEIQIGNKVINPKEFYRKKTKILIALLILARSRECGRDQLAKELWPKTNLESARRNFYTVMSDLKRALSFEGRCPYIIRSQTGYRFDMNLTSSDVYEFDDISRSLLFERIEVPEWEYLYAKITKDYTESLMPSELENETIISSRKRIEMQLVDGLVATSSRLIHGGQPRGALWFAREAMKHDTKREDVFIALMEAQIACEQRGEALETYFKCLRYLSDELGIDPSLRLVELYRSIIETEEVF